ncbi:MAG: hypothetical protein ACOWWR_09800 [Eubacteriales bacterium]
MLIPEVKSYSKIKLQEIRKYYLDWRYIEIGIRNPIMSICIWECSKYGRNHEE